MKTLAAWWLCAAFWCSGQAASTNNPRFLVALDTSFSMSKNSSATRNVVADLVASGFGAQIHPGQRFEVWSFSERVQKLVLFDWKDYSASEAVRSVELSLARQRHRGLTDFRLLIEAASALARTSPVFTFIVVTDGEDDFIGTPYDARVNRAFSQRTTIPRRDRQLFVVVMLAENGAWTRCAISAGGRVIEIPAPPSVEPAKEVPEVLPKPLEIARAATSLANGLTQAPAAPPGVRSTAVAPKEPERPPSTRIDPAVPGRLANSPQRPSQNPGLAEVPNVPSGPVTQLLEKSGAASGRQAPGKDQAKVDNAAADVSRPIAPVELQQSEVPAEPPPASDSKGIEVVSKNSASAGGTTPPSPSVDGGDLGSNVGRGTSAVAEAFLAPHPAPTHSLRFWFIGTGFVGAFCALLLLWRIRARSQPLARSSLISQYMEKEGGSGRRGKQ